MSIISRLMKNKKEACNPLESVEMVGLEPIESMVKRSIFSPAAEEPPEKQVPKNSLFKRVEAVEPVESVEHVESVEPVEGVEAVDAVTSVPIEVKAEAVEEAVEVKAEAADKDKAEVAGKEENTDIKSYFSAKGIHIDFSREKSCVAPIEKLSFSIAQSFGYSKNFLKHIRDSVSRKHYHLNYSLSSAESEAEKKAVIALADKFCEYGIISNVFYNKSTNVITGTLSTAPRVLALINGDYFEFYGRAVAERVVKESARKYGVDYEIHSNAIVTVESKPREIDTVFRVGKHIFWSEFKCGKFSDFDIYRKLGLQLGVNPDRHILLSAETSDEACEGIGWLYEFYVANITNYENKLKHMINKAFTGGKNND